MINETGLPMFLFLGVLLAGGGGTSILIAGAVALGHLPVMPPVASGLLAQLAGQ